MNKTRMIAIIAVVVIAVVAAVIVVVTEHNGADYKAATQITTEATTGISQTETTNTGDISDLPEEGESIPLVIIADDESSGSQQSGNTSSGTTAESSSDNKQKLVWNEKTKQWEVTIDFQDLVK